jgi:tetratricopeptide (TPR) repeat protein
MFTPQRLPPLSRSCLLVSASLLISLCGARAQPPASMSNMSNQDQAELHAAIDAYDQGNLKEAEPKLRVLAARYPKNFEANEALGSLYAESGDVQRALPYLEHAAAIAPKQAVARANLGAAWLKQGDSAKAVRELQLAATIDPANLETQSDLGQALMQVHQPATAAEAFGAAVALAPGNADLAYDEALALYQADAIARAASVLALIPAASMTAPAYSLAGDVEEKLGHYQDAVMHYQSAARLDPSAANLYSLTIELLRHWTWSEAQQVAAYASTRYPEDNRFTMAQGVALFADGKYPQAAEIFSSLLAREPNSEMYADLLGRSCGAVTDTPIPHCGELEQFADKHPRNARAAIYAATRILQQPVDAQDSAKAESLLHQAVAADPNLADAYFELGVLAQQRLQWQQSAGFLEKAVALRPSYAEAHYRLSRAYAHLGEHDQAQQQMALQQQYAQQEKDALNAHMKEVVTFLLKPS